MSNWYKQAKQSSLKNKLIKLGDQRPELRKHIRPVLDRISSREKQGISKQQKKLEVSISRLDEPWKVAEDHGLEDLYFEEMSLSDGRGFTGFLIGVFPGGEPPTGWDVKEFEKDMNRVVPFDLQLFGEQGGEVILEF